jgi:hypothetical protein
MVISFLHVLLSPWNFDIFGYTFKLWFGFFTWFFFWNLFSTDKISNLNYPFYTLFFLLQIWIVVFYNNFQHYNIATLGPKNYKHSWNCSSIISHRKYIFAKKMKVKMNYSFDFNISLNLILCQMFLKGMQSAFVVGICKGPSFGDFCALYPC